MNTKRILLPLSLWLITSSAVASEPMKKEQPKTDQPKTVQQEEEKSGGDAAPTVPENVTKLSNIYKKFGFSAHQKLAEIAVKHDLDRTLLAQSEQVGNQPQISQSWLDKVTVDGDRLSKKSPYDFPYQVKCSEHDKRIITLCIKSEFFKPKISAYYDRGKDKPGKIDLFQNGSATVSVDLVSIYLPWRFGYSEHFDNWYWGPTVGLGIGTSSAQAKTKTQEDNAANDDAPTSSMDSSPVALFSVGFRTSYAPSGAQGFSFSVEAGGVRGYSTNEELDNKTDKAAYLGFSINIPTSSGKAP